MSNIKCKKFRLEDSNKDLTTQLQEYRELWSNFVQVTKAYQKQCERNDMFQGKLLWFWNAENSSSRNKPSPQVLPTPPIITPNPFSIIIDEVPESVESVHSVPSLSLLTPDKQPPHRTDSSELPMPAINRTKFADIVRYAKFRPDTD